MDPARFLSPHGPLVHRVEGAVPEDLRAPGLQVRVLEGTRMGGEAELLAEFARALALPAWFGRNWNALDEALSDLDLMPGPALLLVLKDAERVLQDDEEGRGILADVLATALASWAEAATPESPLALHLLVAGETEGVTAWMDRFRALGLPED